MEGRTSPYYMGLVESLFHDGLDETMVFDERQLTNPDQSILARNLQTKIRCP